MNKNESDYKTFVDRWGFYSDDIESLTQEEALKVSHQEGIARIAGYFKMIALNPVNRESSGLVEMHKILKQKNDRNL